MGWFKRKKAQQAPSHLPTAIPAPALLPGDGVASHPQAPQPDIAALPTIPRPPAAAVPAALAMPAAMPPDAEAINDALSAFIGARTYDETRAVLTAQQATLFHTETLLALLMHARALNDEDDADQRQLELLHLGILLVGREQGIAAAWDWLLPILRREKEAEEREAQQALAQLTRQMEQLSPVQQAHLNDLMARQYSQPHRR